MENIFNYLKDRGDISLKEEPFNEIDNLILARFSYFPFDNIIGLNETVTIRELSKRFKNENIDEIKILWEYDKDFFPLMGETKRFGEMKATKFVNKINFQQEKQFSAITILLPDDTIYVSYRGTDNTLVGWKEDLNMSFKSHIASQIDAVKYLNTIAKLYPNKLRVGGHSKGGNLAVYASVFANTETKDRIINIYNNDGPGFSDDITEMTEYKKMIKRVHTYLPQSSIVGRLLNHEEECTVIESSQIGIMQHDLYSWKINGNSFVRLDEVTNVSEIVHNTINEWLIKVEPEQREQVINILYSILNSTDAGTLTKLKENWFENAKIILKSYKNVDSESKAIIYQVLHYLVKSGRDNIFESLPKLKKSIN